MKTTLSLLAAAALSPLTLSAQSPAPAAGGIAAPQVTPVTSPAAGKLPSVQFAEASLEEVIRFLQDQSKAAGTDPNVDPLNIVITPGLAELRVPTLSLRNVSPTEVLTVVATVLGLQLEPVSGDAGAPIAWLIKDPNAQAGGVAAGGIGVSPPPVTPPAAASGDAAGGATASGFPGGGGPIVYPSSGSPYAAGVPYAVQIAASSATGGAGGGTAPSQSRVFGVASLVASNKGDASVEVRTANLERLIRSLEKMATDQGSNAQINAYGELDILVVKSADPAVLALIAEAIDAMKSNVKNDNSAQTREQALRAEMNALKGQLSIIQTEKDAQRQTLLDQIELLKAGSRAEDAPRPKR